MRTSPALLLAGLIGVSSVAAQQTTTAFVGRITSYNVCYTKLLRYSFGLCRQFLDDLVLVDDEALCRALYHLFRSAKLAVEPAGAASTAALLGPLRDRLRDARVGLVVCGANIDHATFATYLAHGAATVTASGD